MTVWVLHCWARDLPWGEKLSEHDTLQAAVDAAVAWMEADRYVLSWAHSVYSIAELRYDDPR